MSSVIFVKTPFIANPVLKQSVAGPTNSSGTATSNSATFSSNTTTGDTLIVAASSQKFAAGTPPAITSITISAGSASFSKVISIPGIGGTGSTSAGSVEIWAAPNIIGAATPSVTVNFAAVADILDLIIYEFSGLSPSVMLDGTPVTANSTVVSPVTGNLTTSSQKNLALAAFSNNGQLTMWSSAGWTNKLITSAITFLAEYLISTTPQTNLHATATLNQAGGSNNVIAGFR